MNGALNWCIFAPMRQTLFIVGLLLLGLTIGPGHADAQTKSSPYYSVPPAKEGFSYPDCYCTDSKGKRVDMGKTACLAIGQRQVVARCEMSLNNPVWREKSEGCPGV